MRALRRPRHSAAHKESPIDGDDLLGCLTELRQSQSKSKWKSKLVSDAIVNFARALNF